ncbi:MAG TPA: hypothetical protein VF911_02830, partial [Thermoanaerobaculia bacterium]
ALVDAGLYRVEFRQAQDYDLWQRMAPFGLFANLPEPLYRWRLRRGGAGMARGETQRDYGRLALLCTDHRAAGQPEPPLDLALVQRRKVRGLFGALRRVEGEAAYEFSLARFRLRAGERGRARAHAFAVLKANPVNVYAWLLVVLSFLPSNEAQRVWQRATTFYRKLIWRRRSGL